MKKWIIMMIVIGLSLPILNVNAEEVDENIELVVIEHEEYAGHEDIE